ncbi:pantoate--beta-alanine ligase [Namhaeicola litoreus]|uniref:Pantothenate synthetase n=1 Tax=Namhaeicola litoreus TaxID=1052145 RepID=A0ABW3XYZ6_9FLAO
MKVFYTVSELQSYLAQYKQNNSIGFVPTMGALHAGHISLIKRAKLENDLNVASIFVNPTQFDKEDDLAKYPKTLDSDLNKLQGNCDIIFVPEVTEVYPKLVTSQIFNFDGLDKTMEGAFRKGHFDGVGTVVKRLFEIVEPNRAYFGEKDFQQLTIIKKMVELENLPVEIVNCPIEREKDGLAMSSRNQRLTDDQRNESPLIYKTLQKAQSMFAENDIPTIKKMVEDTFKNNQILDLEYFEIADIETLQPTLQKIENKTYRAFIAVFADAVRLIDNIALN